MLLPPYTPLLVLRKDDEKKEIDFGIMDMDATLEHMETEEGRNAAGLFSGPS